MIEELPGLEVARALLLLLLFFPMCGLSRGRLGASIGGVRYFFVFDVEDEVILF